MFDNGVAMLLPECSVAVSATSKVQLVTRSSSLGQLFWPCCRHWMTCRLMTVHNETVIDTKAKCRKYWWVILPLLVWKSCLWLICWVQACVEGLIDSDVVKPAGNILGPAWGADIKNQEHVEGLCSWCDNSKVDGSKCCSLCGSQVTVLIALAPSSSKAMWMFVSVMLFTEDLMAYWGCTRATIDAWWRNRCSRHYDKTDLFMPAAMSACGKMIGPCVDMVCPLCSQDFWSSIWIWSSLLSRCLCTGAIAGCRVCFRPSIPEGKICGQSFGMHGHMEANSVGDSELFPLNAMGPENWISNSTRRHTYF